MIGIITMFFYSYFLEPKIFFHLISSVNPPVKNNKFVALIFDDGPYGQATSKILDILKEKGVKATFFVIGKNTEEYPDILKREFNEGHIIGNHSYDHSKYLSILPGKELINNIEKANNAIYKIIGKYPKFFRPPYGLQSPLMAKDIRNKGYVIVLCDDNTRDYEKSEDSNEIITSILKGIKPTAIIELHDGRDVKINYPRENLIKALPLLIDKIREKGYEFVTVDKIIKEEPYFP